MMREVNRKSGTSFLIVTHNLEIARGCDRTIELVDGQIVPAGAVPAAA
jgi:lipoprotein-releasing system ATP-binding protein